MRLSLFAAGKVRPGPEREMTERFVDRIGRSGPGVGLGPAAVQEYDPARRLPHWLESAAGRSGTVVCALDKDGRLETSQGFARLLARWRDSGLREAAFLIGGPDGVPASLAANADRRISFGRMTFPHMIVRIMLAEQLYRAVTILRGDPYHRE